MNQKSILVACLTALALTGCGDTPAAKKNFVGITFENKTIVYDGQDHFNDMVLTGELPLNTTTSVAASKNNEIVTTAVEVGQYSFSITLENPSYNTLVLDALLTIESPAPSEEYDTYTVKFNELDLGDVKQIFGNGDPFNNKVRDFMNSYADEPFVESVSTDMTNTNCVKIEMSDFLPGYDNVQGLIIGTKNADGEMYFTFGKKLHSVTIKAQQYYNIYTDYYEGQPYDTIWYDGQGWAETPEGGYYYFGYFEIGVNDQKFKGPGETYEYDKEWNLLMNIPEVASEKFIIDSNSLTISGYASVRTRIYEMTFEVEK